MSFFLSAPTLHPLTSCLFSSHHISCSLFPPSGLAHPSHRRTKQESFPPAPALFSPFPTSDQQPFSLVWASLLHPLFKREAGQKEPTQDLSSSALLYTPRLLTSLPPDSRPSPCLLSPGGRAPYLPVCVQLPTSWAPKVPLQRLSISSL